MNVIDLPVSNLKSDYLTTISKLPDANPVSLLCLPANIDRLFQRQKSTEIIKKLKNMVSFLQLCPNPLLGGTNLPLIVVGTR